MSIEKIGSQIANIAGLNESRKQPPPRTSTAHGADSGARSAEQDEQTSTDVSAMSDAELEAAAAKGNSAAQQELQRRKAAKGTQDSSAAGTAAGGEKAPSTILDIEV